MVLKRLRLLFCLCLFAANATAQTLPVGLFSNLEDVYRRDQLLSYDSLGSSYLIRPIFSPGNNKYSIFKKITGESRSVDIRLLPIVAIQRYNTAFPTGANDGSMINAKGYQSQLTAGIFARVGILSVQFRPEYTYAQNQRFKSIFESTNAPDSKNAYLSVINQIDIPERFGDGAYNNFNLGQSSIRVNLDRVSLGLSNENLWWGPGRYNSLLMSNNADGFKHVTLNTIKPIPTVIGSFEAQAILGRLESSGITGPNNSDRTTGDRNIYGFVMTYQPRITPGLFIGADLSVVRPVKKAAQIIEDNTQATASINTGSSSDNYASLFARWVMPESNMEAYFQYGFKQYNYSLSSDVPSAAKTAHSNYLTGYIAGFSKLLPFQYDPNTFISINVEVTDMGNKNPNKLTPLPMWYANPMVPDGYTNNGQLLGAALGPGGNMQTLEVSWVQGLKKIGLKLDRIVHNNDLFYTMLPYTTDPRRHWVDLALGGDVNWNFSSFLINANLTYTKAYNYQWSLEQPKDIYPNYWDWDKQDVNNLAFQLSLMYRF